MAHTSDCRCGNLWRFELVDVLTGFVKKVVHPVSVTFETPLSKVGPGSMILASGDITPFDIWPNRTAIYISLLDGDPEVSEGRRCQYAGLIQKFDGLGSPTLNIGFDSIESYIWKRALVDTHGGLSYNAVGRPQTEIAFDLVNFTIPGGIQLAPRFEESNVLRDLSYLNRDQKNIGQILDDLISAINGIQYEVTHAYGAGQWLSVITFMDQQDFVSTKTLKGGRDGSQQSLTVDGQDQATWCYGTGADYTEGGVNKTVRSIGYDASNFYPKLDATVAWRDVLQKQTLDAYTRGYIVNHRDPLATPSMTIPGLTIDPDDLKPGNVHLIDIANNNFTFKAPSKILSIAWTLDENGVTRALTLLPLERPAQSIMGLPIVDNGVPGPDPGPDPTPGLVMTIPGADRELSGMTLDKFTPNLLWFSGDEGANPQVEGVYTSDDTGDIEASYGVSGSTLNDPESMKTDPASGDLIIADIGNNDDSGSVTPKLIRTPSPGPGVHGVQTSTRYELDYPFSNRNAETLLIHPISGVVSIITKENKGQVVSFGTLASMSTSSPNAGSVVASNSALKYVSDADYNSDGTFAFVRVVSKQETLVFETNGWTQVGSIATPEMYKSESIIVEPGSKSFLVSTEIKHSDLDGTPVYRVIIPSQWRQAGGGGSNFPADVLALSKNWKLTTPVKGSGSSPKEIFQPQLATFFDDGYFHVVGGLVEFKARCDGYHTPNSSYPRSELREMKNNGQDEASWGNSSGTHSLILTQSINYTMTNKKHVVAGQIHDAEDDVVMIRLEDTHLFVEHDGDNLATLDAAYVPGTEFTVAIVATPSGIDVTYNGVEHHVSDAVVSSGWYFKAGCYTQSNTDHDSGPSYGVVLMKSLTISHTA